MTLQIVHGADLMEINQAHRKQFFGFSHCEKDCMVCLLETSMNQLENHMALADHPSRQEPFTEIGATLIEQVILQARKNPIILLNSSFISSMFRCSLELVKEEMNSITASPFICSGRLERIHDIYRHITKDRFEPNLSLDQQAQAIPSPGDFSEMVKVFRQCEPDEFVGKTSLLYVAINFQMTFSIQNKIPARMLKWSGDETTLNEAVPKNAKYGAYIKKTAFNEGFSIGDSPVDFPDDKYDEEHGEFWINPTVDDQDLNENPTLAIYPNFLDPSKRVIII